MNTRISALAALALAVTLSGVARAADDDLAAALEKVSKEQIAAFNKEDANATMAFAYSKAPGYEAAKAELGPLFKDTDARAEQIGFKYVGHDDEFAVARVKVKVTSDQAGFLDNVVDTLMIFHTEGGAWKVWDTYVLGSEFVK